MTYYESAEGITITRQRAINVVKSHYASVTEFLSECGNKENYNAQFVLEWLGY